MTLRTYSTVKITLDTAVFPPNTTCGQLDAIVKRPLWDERMVCEVRYYAFRDQIAMISSIEGHRWRKVGRLLECMGVLTLQILD